MGIHAEIGLLQQGEALQEQTCADDQDNGQRSFTRHQQVLQTIFASSAGETTLAFAQPITWVRFPKQDSGWNTGEKTGRDRDGGGDAEKRPVKPHPRQSETLRERNREQTAAPESNCRTHDRRENRQQRTFRQNLADQACDACPQGASHAELTFTGDRSNENQITHIDAADQQHKARGGHQDEKRNSHVACGYAPKRNQVQTASLVTRRVGLGQPRRDTAEFLAGGGYRNARPQSRNSTQVSA